MAMNFSKLKRILFPLIGIPFLGLSLGSNTAIYNDSENLNYITVSAQYMEGVNILGNDTMKRTFRAYASYGLVVGTLDFRYLQAGLNISSLDANPYTKATFHGAGRVAAKFANQSDDEEFAIADYYKGYQDITFTLPELCRMQTVTIVARLYYAKSMAVYETAGKFKAFTQIWMYIGPSAPSHLNISVENEESYDYVESNEVAGDFVATSNRSKPHYTYRIENGFSIIDNPPQNQLRIGKTRFSETFPTGQRALTYTSATLRFRAYQSHYYDCFLKNPSDSYVSWELKGHKTTYSDYARIQFDIKTSFSVSKDGRYVYKGKPASSSQVSTNILPLPPYSGSGVDKWSFEMVISGTGETKSGSLTIHFSVQKSSDYLGSRGLSDYHIEVS